MDNRMLHCNCEKLQGVATYERERACLPNKGNC